MINRDLETLRIQDVQRACRELYELDRTVARVALLHPVDYEPIFRSVDFGPADYVRICFYAPGNTYREVKLMAAKPEKIKPGNLFVGTEEQAQQILEFSGRLANDL